VALTISRLPLHIRLIHELSSQAPARSCQAGLTKATQLIAKCFICQQANLDIAIGRPSVMTPSSSSSSAAMSTSAPASASCHHTPIDRAEIWLLHMLAEKLSSPSQICKALHWHRTHSHIGKFRAKISGIVKAIREPPLRVARPESNRRRYVAATDVSFDSTRTRSHRPQLGQPGARHRGCAC